MLAMLPRAGKRDAVSRRVVRIATTLVEQHADVNVVMDGCSPLTYACQALQWPLIELLLLHGARLPSRQPSGLFDGLSSRSDSSRFAALVKKIGPVPSRPPRPCPCWSGKPLSKCHAADQHLYPAHFFCPCGSRKSYGYCCSRREFQTYEAWHTGLERIEIRTERPSLDLPAVRVLAQIPNAKELSGMMYNFDGFMNLPPGYQEQNKRMRCAMADRLLALRAVDPGYAYAMKEVDFIPQ
ncbi:uncharacterized protein LAESUDRAFT_459678 [Laetiporus sulphureus 93-53]|uniref:Uncharacterized protein n=1 Tax=Laetiporus sulphureus 93-53 TaxID=1314785 RepID=A0A165BRI5_9APHY|nr:uncharacterized protein LAESUDRAFT_459678 [Laetiporus sulphureus 93-53]KZT01523.1 hypothetical protein LAESUDRAFT_459678 [Laetiporus sulphureus 93-53]